MATIVAYVPAVNLPPTSGFVTGDATTITTTSLDGTVVQHFYGSGIAFNGSGNVTAGTITAADLFINGVKIYDVTGLSHDASTVVSLYASGDDALRTYLYNGADTFAGSSGSDFFNGYGGNDSLSGNAGNDLLAGGAGSDTLAGGLGNDFYLDYDGFDVIQELAGEGRDTVQSVVDYTLGDNLENLVLIGAAILGTGNDLNNAITGNAQNNSLVGGAGGDTLSGGSGIDTLVGGSGDDVYVYDAVDSIVELAAGGTDTLQSAVTVSLASLPDVENITLTGSADADATGNELDNVITGNAGDNHLSGAGGNDTLSGGATDTLDGGAGNDTYVIVAGTTVMEAADAGTDTVSTDLAVYTLLGNFENLTGAFSTGMGNGLGNLIVHVSSGAGASLQGLGGSDTLFGSIGNDTLDGGLGADSLDGGAGNDAYVLNDADIVAEAASSGNDTITASIDGYVLAQNVENLVLGGSAISGTGNELANALTGNALANQLFGMDGPDTLDGGAGTDTLVGGAGDDSYTVEGADQVLELVGQGIDTITSAATYSLAGLPNIENLVLSGGSANNATGNQLANLLVGNASANVLTGDNGDDTMSGGGGRDTLYGGVGNDVLDGGSAGRAFLSRGGNVLTGGTGDDVYVIGNTDSVWEAPGEGIDTVRISHSYWLGANIENLELTGIAWASGTGNELANGIYGNAGANVLSGRDGDDALAGGLGNDTLNGGEGSDTLTGGGGADRFIFDTSLSAADADTIQDFDWLDKIWLDDDVYVELGQADGTRSLASSNFWTGSAAHDADDRIIYNSVDGHVLYDADGTGATSGVLVAVVGDSSHPTLTAADFQIIA